MKMLPPDSLLLLLIRCFINMAMKSSDFFMETKVNPPFLLLIQLLLLVHLPGHLVTKHFFSQQAGKER